LPSVSLADFVLSIQLTPCRSFVKCSSRLMSSRVTCVLIHQIFVSNKLLAVISHVNKDLTLKARTKDSSQGQDQGLDPQGQDQGLKAKDRTKDLTLKARTKDSSQGQDQGLDPQGQDQGLKAKDRTKDLTLKAKDRTKNLSLKPRTGPRTCPSRPRTGQRT